MTIAGSRLDLQMGFLWYHLDTKKPPDEARRASGSEQARAIRRLAQARLTGDMRAQVLAAMDQADAARRRRNDVVHQDWLLRGSDAFRPVSDWISRTPEERATYLEEWERESKPSTQWQRVPRDSIAVESAQALDDLRQVERALAATTDTIQSLTFVVASARDTGKPDGYVHPAG